MAHATEQKIKLLVLYDLLCRLTDENHALNTDEIIALLAEKKIAVSRKILLQDIALLNQYGYEVLTYKKKYHYYYVVNRHFDSAEIALLSDAVQASKLSASHKQTLTNKLMTTMGNFQATDLTAAAHFGTMPQRNNRYIIYTISEHNALYEYEFAQSCPKICVCVRKGRQNSKNAARQHRVAVAA